MDTTEEVVKEPLEQPPFLPDPESDQSFLNKINFVIVLLFTGLLIIGTFLINVYRNTQYPSQTTSKAGTSLPPTIQPTNLAIWKIYTDDINGFKLLYPEDYLLSTANQGATPILNHNIDWGISPKIECGDEKGDCPYIEQKREAVELTGYVTIKITGILASIGGNIPGSYVSYYVKHPTRESYFRMTLHEVPLDDNSPEFDSKYPMNRTPQTIPKAEEIVLDKIIQTFSFTTEN